MKRKAEKAGRKQGEALRVNPWLVTEMIRPLIEGAATTRQSLLEWVHGVGLGVLQEVFRADAERLVGPKGKHQTRRRRHHWGSTPTALTFGGRRIQVEAPRVRTQKGVEIRLPSVDAFRGRDPMTERVANQLILGVSTRNYERSLEAAPEGMVSRGTSKSATSRAFIARSQQRLGELLDRRLEELKIVALMVDGVQVGEESVIVALGITDKGIKEPLGLCAGSTENSTVCTGLLNGLIDRGLKIEDRTLCVIDGGKGLRKALLDVLGDLAVIQRCQVHKVRNIEGYLPQNRRGYARAAMRAAYKAASAEAARQKLKKLGEWLQRQGHTDAAASLREGLEETLTVLKLGLGQDIRRFFATTNCIENMIGTIRRIGRNVKRWRNGHMVRRWVGLGLLQAGKGFRRIKGHAQITQLVVALKKLDDNAKRVA